VAQQALLDGVDKVSVELSIQHDAMVQSRLRAIMFHMKHDTMGSSFQAWVQLAVHSKRIQNTLHKATMRLRYRTASIYFEYWASDVLDAKNAAKEEAAQRALRDRVDKVLGFAPPEAGSPL
jgi:hypothetical protein